MRQLLLAAALVAAASCSLAGQRLGPPADRPHLRDITDTNDAQAYYQAGLDLFERDPGEASAAFYWAARINPGWGEALYARRSALLMKDSRLMRQLFEGRRGSSSPEARRLDSLQFRALMLSPFLYRRLDRTMLVSYIREDASRRSRMAGQGDPSRTELDYYIDRYLSGAGPRMRAWMAYGAGDFSAALRYYAVSIDSHNAAGVHLERGRIFSMRGEVDSATSELHLALDELRKQDDKDLVVFYDSKALTEYSIAVLLEGTGNTDGAREAYGRALQEDLAYYPAHMRLGLLALGKGDTATAVSELALAAQIAGEEPHIRYVNGFVLAQAQHYPEAVVELRHALELEPLYALPYLRLGQVYEQLGKGPEALAAYQGFLDHASQRDMQRAYATQRITEVKEYLAAVKQ
jgi:tetratricopeptide (TPR) repeat protein